MGEEIFMFLLESKYSVSLITVPFCPVAPCPFQILAGVLLRCQVIPITMNDYKDIFLIKTIYERKKLGEVSCQPAGRRLLGLLPAGWHKLKSLLPAGRQQT